jgi:hypothetical protein
MEVFGGTKASLVFKCQKSFIAIALKAANYFGCRHHYLTFQIVGTSTEIFFTSLWICHLPECKVAKLLFFWTSLSLSLSLSLSSLYPLSLSLSLSLSPSLYLSFLSIHLSFSTSSLPFCVCYFYLPLPLSQYLFLCLRVSESLSL